MAYPEKRKEIAFNIGMFQAQFVAEVYTGIFRNFLKADFENWFLYLHTMRDILNSDLKKEEADKFDITEEEVHKKYNAWRRIKNKIEYVRLKKEYIEFVRKQYEYPILNVMREVGYMPSKRDRARLGF